MRALTIREFWATEMQFGVKWIETRAWSTPYRGDVLLTASRRPHSAIAGHAFMIAELYDVRPMQREDEAGACCAVYPRAHAFFFRHRRRIAPFPVRGRLGLFHVDIDPSQIEVLEVFP